MSFRIKHKTRLAPSSQAPQKADLYILDYTEKSIVVMGDTIPHSKELAELGGLYNPTLRIGAGWIFSKARKDSVETYIKTGKVERFQFDKTAFEKKSSDNNEKTITERQLRKMFREFRGAFEADEEYEGSSILEVICQLEDKYAPVTAIKATRKSPKSVNSDDSVDVDEGSEEVKSSFDEQDEISDPDFDDVM